jgi:hypothetical protein
MIKRLAALIVFGVLLATSGGLNLIRPASAQVTQAQRIQFVNDFRLTLTTATPVTTADVSGGSATTVYWTPMTGNRITLFTSAGTPTTYTSAELTLAVPAIANQIYDVFVYNNSGTPAIEGLAWTNDTTRATGLTRTNGRWTKTGDATRLYVGSYRTTAGGVSQTEDSLAKRFLWNAYNRVRRNLRVLEATSSWTYSTNAFRQANAAAANQLALVVGLSEVPVDITVVANASNTTAGQDCSVGIGEDSTTVVATGTTMTNASFPVAAYRVTPTAHLIKYPAIGYHTYAWEEIASGGGTVTWFGTAGTAYIQSGIMAVFES